MAIRIIKATMQMRHGREEDFDPSQMTVGEWAVSEDTKKVWMCFLPGFVLRMATYEAFEQDMQEIQLILATCQNIQAAVERFVELAEQHETQAEYYSILSESWAVGGTGIRTAENTNNSKFYSEQSSSSATMSKSWAVGRTDTRNNEDFDNSKYYSQQSKNSSEISKEYLTKVEDAGNEALNKIQEALGLNIPVFMVDLGTGHLLYEGGSFDFAVNNGNLEWGLTV